MTAAVTAACSLALVPGAAAKPRVKVSLPATGQTTVAVAQLRYKGDAAPRRLKLKLPNRARLAPDERGIYAVYRKTRGRTTALTVVSLLLRKEGATTTRPSAPLPLAGASENVAGIELGFFFVQSHFLDAEAVEREEARREEDATLQSFIQVIGREAPIEPPAEMEEVLEYGGVVEPPASSPGKLGKSLLDTGHYDDGHSFGWNSAGVKPAIGSWLNLTASTDVSYERLIEELESRLKADLDGDGSVDKPKAGVVETEIGPPVIN